MTQTVYIPVDVKAENKVWLINIDGSGIFVEKKENVYVFTPQELLEYKKQVAGDAFKAGRDNGTCLYPTPNKTEYLNNLNP